MSFKKSALAGIMVLFTTIPAFADGLTIKDAYLRAAGPTAKSAGVFMEIINETNTDDRMIAASSDVAKKVELHTHIKADDGVMQMREKEDGFAISAGDMHALARGGDHVMLMGLNQKVEQGEMVTVTLTFEKAGDITIDVPVDLTR